MKLYADQLPEIINTLRKETASEEEKKKAKKQAPTAEAAAANSAPAGSPDAALKQGAGTQTKTDMKNIVPPLAEKQEIAKSQESRKQP